MHDGVPEKIFFKTKKGDVAEKFEFMADFSIAEQISQ
jgi:hypothetical protein